MTRRQIYFFDPNNNIYYLSEELNGDKEEFERFGSSDACEKTWVEIATELSRIQTLSEFMETVARVMRYYRSSIPSELPGTRLIVKHSRDDLEVKDETWGIVAGCPRVFKDNRFSICGGPQMFYNGRPLYGESDFSYSSVKVGDYVTQDVVDDAMDCLPPACMRSDCSQMGEPYSSKYDDQSGKWRNTYTTFSQISSQRHNNTPRENRIWKYCGHCFCGETEERGMDMPIVAASKGGSVGVTSPQRLT